MIELRKLRVLLDVRGRYVLHSVAKVVFAVWWEKRWSHRELVVLVVSERSVNVSRKCCPEVKPLGVRAAFCIAVDIVNFRGWRKVVPVCGVLNSANSFSTGNTWSKRNRRQGVHKLDGFPHYVHATAAIEEQTVRRLHWMKLFSQRESVLAAFPNYCCPVRWFGLNRISHPDWVKLCVDPNGRIKLRAKQKYEIPFATVT